MSGVVVNWDETSQKEIDKLKQVFGVEANALVVRKALALATLVAREADHKGVVRIKRRCRGKNVILFNRYLDINLSQ